MQQSYNPSHIQPVIGAEEKSCFFPWLFALGGAGALYLVFTACTKETKFLQQEIDAWAKENVALRKGKPLKVSEIMKG